MTDLILTTFDWVPETPRGYVRDIRVRWALEEAGLPYRVNSVPFRDRGIEHFSHQPFGQVPWLTDGDISIFESGAILLHLGNRSEVLLPAVRAAAARLWSGCLRRSIQSRWQACPGPYSSSPGILVIRQGGSVWSSS
jgi:glutathione S-transferase